MATYKTKKRLIKQVGIVSLFIVALFTLPSDRFSHAEDTSVKIGVQAKRGMERCIEKWTPTAEYLTEMIPGKTFVIIPLDFEETYSAVEKGKVDFILANPSIYVELESRHGVNRIATLKNLRFGDVFTQFGGVIFCKANRNHTEHLMTDLKGKKKVPLKLHTSLMKRDIEHLTDLMGKTFMAVSETSFGGWRVAWRELKHSGIDPYRDFVELSFGGTHDAVVFAVRDGKVTAGTVRTDTLERMDKEGKIKLENFHVINKHGEGAVNLPFLHSTRLYPEWPFAKVKHTPDEMAEKIATALLEMPRECAAAKAARCAGWTIPLNYQSVHDCLKELKLGPYEDLGKITFTDVFRKYWHLIIIIVVLFAVMAGGTIFILRLSRSIKGYNVELQKEVEERKQTEEALKVSGEKFRAICSSAQDAIIMMDNEGNISLWNNAAEDIFAYSTEEAIGQNLHKLIAPKPLHEDHRKAFVAFRKTGRGSAVGKTLELQAIKKGGKEIPVELSLSAVKLNDRWHSVGIVRDISARKQAEQELEMAKEFAEAANRAKSEFLANMSHEIRTPMNGILGFADLLLEEELSEEQREAVNTIKKSGENLLNLINDILDLSKVESSKMDLETIPFNVENLVLDIGESMRTSLGEKPIETNCQIGDIHTNLLGDPTRLRQIITNLIGNAIKFTEEGEIVIGVATEKEDDKQTTLKFSVRDTGIGIPEDKLDTIFESFKQADGSTTREYGGTGLGLTISKKFAQLMGGDMWAVSPSDCRLSIDDCLLKQNSKDKNNSHSSIVNSQSKGGLGSIFYFTAIFEKDLDSLEKIHPVDVSQLEGKPILIVDDNETALEVTASIVKRVGMAPILARNGEEALACLKAGSLVTGHSSLVKNGINDKCQMTNDHFPELAIIDITLPGMSGYELAEKITELTGGKIKYIATSGNPFLGSSAEAKKARFDSFVPKPVRPQVLIDLIRTTLGIGEKKQKDVVTRHSSKELISHNIRILYAEDNPVNQLLGKKMFKRMGYDKLEIAPDGLEAVKNVKKNGPYDIIFMDIQMPNMGGLEATQEIRKWESAGEKLETGDPSQQSSIVNRQSKKSQ